MTTKAFLRSRDERKRVEMRFAHLKTHHGFERLRLRGLSDYEVKSGQWICNTKELLPDGAPFEGEVDGHHVKLLNAKQLAGGEVLDLTEDIPPNYEFFTVGPGYGALDM
jgi:hypothetical protein